VGLFGSTYDGVRAKICRIARDEANVVWFDLRWGQKTQKIVDQCPLLCRLVRPMMESEDQRDDDEEGEWDCLVRPMMESERRYVGLRVTKLMSFGSTYDRVRMTFTTCVFTFWTSFGSTYDGVRIARQACQVR
jgi:hypothetical protein